MARLTILIAGMVFVHACAFTPQKTNLRPALSLAPSGEGRNITVAVRVVDERPSTSLGRRGMAYGPAAEITAAQELETVVQEQIADGLQKKGFNPTAYDDQKDPRLTIEIRLLEYSTSQGYWTSGVHVRAALKAVGMRSGKTYERMYRSDKEERVIWVPVAETNERWINETLTDVLRQVFDDSALFRFLAG